MNYSPSHCPSCERLVAKIADLEFRLEELTGSKDTVIATYKQAFHLRGWRQPCMLHFLMQKDVVNLTQFHELLYGGRPDADEPRGNAIAVFMWRMRRDLEPYNIKIKNMHNGFYTISPEDKARIQFIIKAKREEANAT